MARTDDCPALDELRVLVDDLAARSSTSLARRDRWVMGELHRAVQYDVLPSGCCGSLRHGLLSREAVRAYLAAAARGDLRTRTLRVGTDDHPENSTNARRGALLRFGRALGEELDVPPAESRREFSPVSERQQRHLDSHVTTWANVLPANVARKAVYVRLAAVVGLVLDTRARSGELGTLTVGDLADDLSAVTLTRRPPGGADPYRETCPLSARTRAALKRWLATRKDLVDGLAGAAPASLWVSVRSGGSTRLAGLPIGPQCLQRQYAQAVAALNADMAGRRTVGWTPLPRTLQRLRHTTADNGTRALEPRPAGPSTGERPAATAA